MFEWLTTVEWLTTIGTAAFVGTLWALHVRHVRRAMASELEEVRKLVTQLRKTFVPRPIDLPTSGASSAVAPSTGKHRFQVWDPIHGISHDSDDLTAAKNRRLELRAGVGGPPIEAHLIVDGKDRR